MASKEFTTFLLQSIMGNTNLISLSFSARLNWQELKLRSVKAQLSWNKCYTSQTQFT
jgi:hypothetical protein